MIQLVLQQQKMAKKIEWSYRKVFIAISVYTLMLVLTFIVYKHMKPNSPKSTKAQFQNIFWNVQKTERVIEYDPRETKLKKIVYWKPFGSHKDFGFGTGQMPFVVAKCRVSACNATLSKDEVNDADAVMFHLPDCRGKMVIPPNRLPHQLYVFIVRESPAHPYLKGVQRYNNFFNIAMTYSREADVLFPFGRIERRGQVPYKPYGKKILQNKERFALAIISHCSTEGRREDVIKSLQAYVKIDVLGGCSKSSKKPQDCITNYGMACIRKITAKYKFYLAFESFLCRDYATEKLYKVLDLSVIPVVYGGSNYTDFLPPHSFIDVRDFKTASSLAAYLTEVASDIDKFLSYFTWRKDYRQTVDIEMAPGPYQVPDPRAFCDLCEYLHVKRTKKRVISNILEVFGSKKFCFKPGDWLKNFIHKK